MKNILRNKPLSPIYNNGCGVGYGNEYRSGAGTSFGSGHGGGVGSCHNGATLEDSCDEDGIIKGGSSNNGYGFDFGVETNTINYHLKEIFRSGELTEVSTIRKFRIVQKEANRSVEREMTADREIKLGMIKIETSEQIGKIVRDVRKGLGITQGMLALTSGTGQRFISDLENSKSTCQLGKTLIVLHTLGIKINFSGISYDEVKKEKRSSNPSR